MRISIISMMLLLLLATSAAFAEEEYNFLKQGYSFFDTFNGGSGGAVGLLEPIQPFNPPIAFNYDDFEVSYAYLDMLVDSYEEVGLLRVWSLMGGTIGIYEDATPDLDYGADPATGIATATDGTAALIGEISTASFIFNTLSETGTFSGLFTWTGGTRYAELSDLAFSEWNIFHGASADASVNVPTGYNSRFAGRVYVMGPTPTDESNWSQIKSLY
jgi:hypothetical protein